MLQLIRIELKRLFSNKLSLIVPIVTSVITLFLLASVIAPQYFSNKRFSTLEIALVLDDDSPDVNAIVNSFLASNNFKELFKLSFYDDLVAGHEAIEHGEAAFLVHVPENTAHKLFYREKVEIDVWLNPDYALETSVSLPIAEQVAMGFNKVQSNIDVIYFETADKFGYTEANDHYYDVLMEVISRLVDRQSIFRIEGISPLGIYLPIEYYSAAVFAFFAALGIVPISGFYAQDFSTATLSRGLVNNNRRYRYLFARIFAGAVYILILCLPMLIALMVIAGSNVIASGSLFVLLFSLVLISLCHASLAVYLSLIFPNGDNAAWVAFFFIIIAAFLGGVFVPNSIMPPVVDQVGKLFPLRASMNAFASTLFNYRFDNLLVPLLSLLAWTLGAILLSLPLFERRLRS